MKNLKVFLGLTFEQELHEYAHFKRFRKLEDAPQEVIYLTEDELARLYAIQLDHLPYLAETRDVFLFACETGLRYSDVKELQVEQVRGDHIIVITKKTKDLLKVPLSLPAQAILSRYAGRADGTALPVKGNAKINLQLKTLATLARIDTPVTKKQQKGNKVVSSTQAKNRTITMHTARRTFVTLALEGKMRPETVMEITGHKDFKMFEVV